jgi:hypothetical protein
MDACEGGRRNSPIRDILHCSRNCEETLVADALAQMLVYMSSNTGLSRLIHELRNRKINGEREESETMRRGMCLWILDTVEQGKGVEQIERARDMEMRRDVMRERKLRCKRWKRYKRDERDMHKR